MNQTASYSDPISSAVLIAGNIGSLLSYGSYFVVAYSLAPALTKLVDIDKQIQLLTPFYNFQSDFKVLFLKWGFTVATSLGYCLMLVSILPYLSSLSLIRTTMVYSLKIVYAVVSIQTIDTLFISVTRRFLNTSKKFNNRKETKENLRFAACIREQFQEIQNGFGSYFLSQISILTFMFCFVFL